MRFFFLLYFFCAFAWADKSFILKDQNSDLVIIIVLKYKSNFLPQQGKANITVTSSAKTDNYVGNFTLNINYRDESLKIYFGQGTSSKSIEIFGSYLQYFLRFICYYKFNHMVTFNFSRFGTKIRNGELFYLNSFY